MDIFNNEKLIKAMAFEKAVIEVLKKDKKYSTTEWEQSRKSLERKRKWHGFVPYHFP